MPAPESRVEPTDSKCRPSRRATEWISIHDSWLCWARLKVYPGRCARVWVPFNGHQAAQFDAVLEAVRPGSAKSTVQALTFQ